MHLCKMCNRSVPSLFQNSHIVPEWMYKDCYNDSHKCVHIDFLEEDISKVQKGIRGSIICESCEVLTSQFDRDGAHALRSPPVFAQVERASGTIGRMEYEQWTGLPFKKVQNFVFSVCLRGSLFQEQARRKHLGEHFQAMRDMLFDDGNLNEGRYPILIHRARQEGHVILPYVDRVQGHHIVKFVGGSLYFEVYVSSHRKPDAVEALCLKKAGTMISLSIDLHETGMFKSSAPSLKSLYEKCDDRLKRQFREWRT